MGSCYIDRSRGRTIQAGKIESFKKAVVGVVGVAQPTAATIKTTTPPVAEVLHGVVTPAWNTPIDNSCNTCTTPAVANETIGAQGQTTPTTATTPISGSNPEFGFNPVENRVTL
jgi:hypothetical protein